MCFLMWIIAVTLVAFGAVQLIEAQVLLGLLCIIAGLLIGPGSASDSDNRSARA